MEEISPHKSRTGLVRIWRAFFYSIDGLKIAYRTEHAFKQEAVLAAILIPIALAVPVPVVHKALLVSSVLVVLLTELLNSAIEAAVDRISFDDHVLAKSAKDCGSAAVLIGLVNCVVVWGAVLWNRFG